MADWRDALTKALLTAHKWVAEPPTEEPAGYTMKNPDGSPGMKLTPWDATGFAGATMYHASPYKFDRFDLSKIGTGEGSQVYGKGIYLADNPEVAKSYAPPIETMKVHRDYLASILRGERPYGEVSSEDLANAQRYLPDVENRINDASFYTVDVPDEAVARMLNYDKLSPASQDALRYDPGGMLSKRLQSAGYPGIRYLDQGSRAAGEGTRNTVLFNAELARILRREPIK